MNISPNFNTVIYFSNTSIYMACFQRTSAIWGVWKTPHILVIYIVWAEISQASVWCIIQGSALCKTF